MTITLAPLLPVWVCLLFGAGLIAAIAIAALRARGLVLTRLALALAALLVLLNPVRRVEERDTRADVAIAVVDRSGSMALDGRSNEVDRALTHLRASAPDVEWQIVEAPSAPDGGTRLLPTLDAALQAAPTDRLAGAVLLTDGIVRDSADALALPPQRPVHLLIAGDPDIVDRRLVVTRVPPYSVVGRPATIDILVDDGPGRTGTARLDWQIDGVAQPPRDVPVGQTVTLAVPVAARGPIEVALSAAPLAREATQVNNRALVRLNGVRDRLRVLLVSGVPYPGGRVWRDVLKSDPNIDLVHFTILRLPQSYDPTPSEQLALIPFPVDELFERQLPRFDLVILDRFALTELLSPVYFARLAAHVRQGGGMLVVAGDEFAQPGSIADTALRDILPALPAGPPLAKPFVPTLTPLGGRHPVTATLSRPWGAWGTQARLRQVRGQLLMTGADSQPLLLLDRVGKGRVGFLGSTDLWWWARDVAGPGPRDDLLRRVGHWLMDEPDLDEERLDVTARNRTLDIVARGLDTPDVARVTGPDGGQQTVALRPRADGAGVARVEVASDGLYRVEAAGKRRHVLTGDSLEMSETRPRRQPLDALAAASGGGQFMLRQDGIPAVHRVDPGDRAAGGDWLGLVRNHAGALTGVRIDSLIPPPAAWALLTALLALAWWRERV